jgi:hypothetical protein
LNFHVHLKREAIVEWFKRLTVRTLPDVATLIPAIQKALYKAGA